MSRYLTEGIRRDIQAGKRVAVLGNTRDEALYVQRDLLGLDVQWDEVRTAHGRELLRLGSGGCFFRTANGNAARGMELDVAILLGGLRGITIKTRVEVMESIWPTRAEIICTD